MTSWFVDSVDVLGGRAFASFRVARSDAGPLHENGGYFIAAPDFAPEPIASTATSWAATRGMFQLGLLNEQGREIEFGRLEDIVEFVRRAYSSGGGGDGGDGDVGPPAVPDGGSPIDPQSEPDDQLKGAAAIQQLEATIREFAAESRKLEVGQRGRPITSHLHGEEVKDDVSLPLAGRIVLTELMRRFPAYKDDTVALRWSNAASATGELLHATGLINEILVSAVKDTDRFGRAASTIAERWFPKHYLRHSEFRPYVLGRLLGLASWQHVPPWLRSWEFSMEFEPASWTGGGYGQDHFSLLFLVPVPASLNRFVGRVSSEPMSLGNLLSFVLGAPQSALNSDRELPHVLSLCLLASALIVAPDRIRGASPTANGNSARLNELTSDALNWMIANLPSIALPYPLEEMIGRAAAMRAGSASDL